MRLYYLGWRDINTNAVVDATVFQLRGHVSFMERARLFSVANSFHADHLFRFISGNICQRLHQMRKDGDGKEPFHVVEDGEFLAHFCFQTDTMVTIAITDKNYPDGVVRRLIASISPTNHSEGDLRDKLKLYQDPKVDKLYEIQRELEETRQVVYESIEKLFARGEKLEELVEKTEKLSQDTKSFYRKARKTRNRWWCFPWLRI